MQYFRRAGIVIFVILLFMPAVLAEKVEWPVSAGGNGHYYEAVSVPDGITWDDANIAATASGGHLVTITSEAENSFVYNLVSDDKYWYKEPQWGHGVGPWLGGYQPAGSYEPSGGWTWVTGEPFSYNNWRSDQPDNYAGGDRILFLGPSPIPKAPTWDDVSQDWKSHSYVVEWDTGSSSTIAGAPPTNASKSMYAKVGGKTAGVQNSPNYRAIASSLPMKPIIPFPVQQSTNTDISGTWRATTQNTGSSDWEFTKRSDGRYDAKETGLGSATGIAAINGKKIRIDWTTNGWSGYYEWDLNDALTEGTGAVQFTTENNNPSHRRETSSISRILTSSSSRNAQISPNYGAIAPLPLIPMIPFPAQQPKNDSPPSAKAQISGVSGSMGASPAIIRSIPKWRATRLASISRLLGINQSANLDLVDQNDSFIDSSASDLTAQFKWRPATNLGSTPASAVWQISIMPFPYDQKNWANPPGLITEVDLRADQNIFTVDFSTFNPTNEEVAQNWMMSRPNLLFQRKVLLKLRDVVTAKLNVPGQSNVQRLQTSSDFLTKVNNSIKSIDTNPRFIASTRSLHVMGVNDSRLISSSAPAMPSGISQVSPEIANRANILRPKIKIGSQNSKSSLVNALPQDQRTYYVRVVLLNETGGCIGLPSEEKEVIVGKPLVEAKEAMDAARIGWISRAASDDIRLAVANGDMKPSWHHEVCYGTYEESDQIYPENMVNWNNRVPRWFAWRSNLTGLSKAEWQVSLVPFSSTELTEPTGLVARGELNLDPADLTSISNCGGFIAKSPDGTRTVGIHQFNIDFSGFAPAPDPNNTLKRNYYVRVVALSPCGPGKFVGYSSPTRNITYGQPDYLKIGIPVPIVVDVIQPDVKVLSYEPVAVTQSDAQYYFIATQDNPPEDKYFPMGGGLAFAKGQIWHKDDHVYIPPQPPEDRSWWDDLVDIVGSIVNFVASVVNWVSEAWNDIKGACTSVISNVVCAGDPDCVSAVGPFVSGGIDDGLLALGIPPEIPNFDQMANLGADYLTKTLVSEAGLPSSGVDDIADKLTSDVVRPGVQEFINTAASGSTVTGLKPDPSKQGHPAYMMVELSNNNDEPTLAGTLTVSEPNHLFKYKSVSVPPLQPHESVTVPVIFERSPETEVEPDLGLGGGYLEPICGDYPRTPENGYAICDEDWKQLAVKQEEFSVKVNCNNPEVNIQELEQSLGKTYNEAQTIAMFYIAYANHGNGHQEVTIAPDQNYPA